MITAAPTSNSVVLSSTITPFLKSTCTMTGTAAIITTNSAVVHPLQGFKLNTPPCISLPYIPVSGYNGNINISWDGISFMTAKFSDDITARVADSMRRLDEIAALQPDWNGNGAAAFSGELIDIARKLVSGLSIQPTILPTGRDSIQMEYEKENGDYLEFELFEGGRLKMFTYLRTGELETKDILLSAVNKVVCNFHGRYI